MNRLETKEWKEVRQKVLVRDESRCRRCSKEAEHVHHVIPYEIVMNDVAELCISICASCHRFLDSKFRKFNGLTTYERRYIEENIKSFREGM